MNLKDVAAIIDGLIQQETVSVQDCVDKASRLTIDQLEMFAKVRNTKMPSNKENLQDPEALQFGAVALMKAIIGAAALYIAKNSTTHEKIEALPLMNGLISFLKSGKLPFPKVKTERYINTNNKIEAYYINMLNSLMYYYFAKTPRNEFYENIEVLVFANIAVYLPMNMRMFFDVNKSSRILEALQRYFNFQENGAKKFDELIDTVEQIASKYLEEYRNGGVKKDDKPSVFQKFPKLFSHTQQSAATQLQSLARTYKIKEDRSPRDYLNFIEGIRKIYAKEGTDIVKKGELYSGISKAVEESSHAFIAGVKTRDFFLEKAADGTLTQVSIKADGDIGQTVAALQNLINVVERVALEDEPNLDAEIKPKKEITEKLIANIKDKVNQNKELKPGEFRFLTKDEFTVMATYERGVETMRRQKICRAIEAIGRNYLEKYPEIGRYETGWHTNQAEAWQIIALAKKYAEMGNDNDYIAFLKELGSILIKLSEGQLRSLCGHVVTTNTRPVYTNQMHAFEVGNGIISASTLAWFFEKSFNGKTLERPKGDEQEQELTSISKRPPSP